MFVHNKIELEHLCGRVPTTGVSGVVLRLDDLLF